MNFFAIFFIFLQEFLILFSSENRSRYDRKSKSSVSSAYGKLVVTCVKHVPSDGAFTAKFLLVFVILRTFAIKTYY